MSSSDDNTDVKCVFIDYFFVDHICGPHVVYTCSLHVFATCVIVYHVSAVATICVTNILDFGSTRVRSRLNTMDNILYFSKEHAFAQFCMIFLIFLFQKNVFADQCIEMVVLVRNANENRILK